jgi:hypothetical protein
LHELVEAFIVVGVELLVFDNEGLRKIGGVFESGQIFLVLEPGILEERVKIVDVKFEIGWRAILVEFQVEHAHEVPFEKGIEREEDAESHLFDREVLHSFRRESFDIEKPKIEHEILFC